MSNGESEKFKIDLEENHEAPGTVDLSLESGIAEMRRSRVPSFALFFAFTAIAGLIFFVYLNLGTRINAITTAGETRIKTVSTGVEDRLEAVSKKIDGIKNDMEKQFTIIESSKKKDKEDIQALSKKISALSKTVDENTQTNTRTLKKISDLNALLEKVKTTNSQSVTGIDARLKTVDGAIKNLSAQGNTISGIKNQLAAFAKRLEDLSTAGIDKKQLNAAVSSAIAAMNETMARRMDQANARHAQELSAVQSEISRIKASVSIASPPKPAAPAPNDLKIPKVTVPAKTTPDGIIEQEIK